MSFDNEVNDEFIDAWHAFTGDEERVTNDPMEATYIGFFLNVGCYDIAWRWYRARNRHQCDHLHSRTVEHSANVAGG